MASDNLSNLGLEADMPEELQRISSETEFTVLLQHFGITAANLNSDIWQQADRERLVGQISHNIATRIAGTRHALTEAQLTALLNPQVQAAAETVQQHAAMTPEHQQSVARVLAQAVYDALPKEIWHVNIERELQNRYNGGTDLLPHTAEYVSALNFYNRLREDNDANDMIAGMAMLAAMDRGGVATAWERQFIQADSETVQRKNVAEAVQDFKVMQPIVLPSGILANASQVDVQNVINEMNIAGGTYAQLNDAITRQNRADNNHRRLTETYEADVVAWEQRKAVHDSAVQAYNQEWVTYHRELGTRGMTPTRPTTTNPGAFPEVRPTKPTPRAFRRFTLTGTFAANIGTIEEAHAKLAELRTTERALQGAINEFTARQTKIGALLALLQALNIQNIPATFPTLASICSGPPLAVNPDALSANFNYTALATEIERNMPRGLKSVDEYSREAVEAGTKRMGGMDICKAVLRADIKNTRPSLSNADADAVVDYIVNRTKVDGILRTSVQDSINDYLDVDGERAMGERVSNWWYGGERDSRWSRPRNTIEQVARALRIGIEAEQRPNWRAASYEQLVGAYFSIKELVDGKGPADLQMTSKPAVAIEELQAISRILTTKYAGQMEKKLVASLTDDEKKSVTRSRARLGQAVQEFLKGDTPEWVKASVKKAHDRADANVSWVSRGTYDIGKKVMNAGLGVGSWMKDATFNNVPSASTVSHYGTEAAKIAAFSLLGGPVIGLAAYAAMKYATPAPAKSK